jgi:PEP-CTERM motif-containing protein
MRWTLGVVSAAALVVFATPPANADTTYYYSGTPFTEFVKGVVVPLPPGLSGLSGSFTVANPLINLNQDAVVPLAFSFTDGVTTITQATASIQGTGSLAVFRLVTSGTGDITGWEVDICLSPSGVCGTVPPGEAQVEFQSENGFLTPLDVSVYQGRDESLGRTLTAGSWSRVPPSAVPEPSSLVLLATGLLAVAGVRRRNLPS